MMKRFLKHALRMQHNEEGSVLIIVAFSLMALIGSTGVAVDMGRINLAQSRLSKSLDSAGLAAGATLSTSDVHFEARRFFDANFQNYMDSTITEFSAIPNADNTIISLSVSATLPMSIMKVLGQGDATITAATEITRETSGLELVMVLDNTGSMSGSKLTSLKTASHDLIDILFGDGDAPDDLWVGMVPFSQSVNVGDHRTSWMDSSYLNSKDWGPSSQGGWGGCVDARSYPADVSDDPPSDGLFNAYYWQDDSNNNWSWWYYGTKRYRSTFTSTRGPNKYCSQEVTPMTSNKGSINSAIDAMTADGYTHINYGAVWGWRMLSPRWQGLWGGEMAANSLPLAYNTPKMNKAAIIMTDGANTQHSRVRTAYGYPSEGVLGTTSTYWGARELDDRLLEVCTEMKNNNIIVYSVVFGDIGSTSENMMRSCATQDSFYFHSPDAATLRQSFKTIGDSLSNLRVSK